MKTFFHRIAALCVAIAFLCLPLAAVVRVPSDQPGRAADAAPDRITSLIRDLSHLSPRFRQDMERLAERLKAMGVSTGMIPGPGRARGEGPPGAGTVSGASVLINRQVNANWNSGSSSWEDNTRYDFTYNIADQVEQQLSWDWTGSAWIVTVRSTWTYDGSLNNTQLLQESWDGSAWTDLFRISYTYDSSAHLLTTVAEGWNDPDWEGIYRWTLNYDGNGNNTEWVWQYNFFGTWTNNTRYVMTYDIVNRLTGVILQTWGGSAWVNNSQTLTTYNGIGRVVSYLYQVWNGAAWADDALESFTYDGSGWLVEDLTQTWAGSWVNRNRTAITHDANGHPVEELYQWWDSGSWANDERIINTYDGGQHITESILQSWSGGWENQTRTRYEYGGATAVGDDPRIASEFRLTPNYPNPFNPSTEIGYSLPSGGRARLTVFDLLGREMAVLLDAVLPAGSYSVRWQAGNLPGGVYFYRLETEGFRETKKMVLMK